MPTIKLPLYNWLNQRSAGVLLHLSSLPSQTGIGNLGAGAYAHIDFMQAAGLRVWQICPLGPTGYGDSPYQCFSAFAGNPYFIDLAPLLADGLIDQSDLQQLAKLPKDSVDFGALHQLFWPILKKASARFKVAARDHFQDYGTLTSFCQSQSNWINDYALFSALKDDFKGACWQDWPLQFKQITQARTQILSQQTQDAVQAHIFYQYLFYGQLTKLRAYAAKNDVQIMGDAPIFVALDSSDVWASPELFQLDRNGSPLAVAGVPPDYFSADGQLWGNPLYAWDAHQSSGFAWWIDRIKSNLAFYDIVRLDHFRGFEAYWSIPASATTARDGKWINSPGLELFQAIHTACPTAKLIAEDLGVITPDVAALRAATGLPGMVVLQFAFGGDAENVYLPHNYSRNSVVYSGTHDNDTTLGWYRNLDEDSQHHVRRYLGVSGDTISWDLVRTAIQSNAYMAILPLQDLMSLDGDARLNTPGTQMGNWQWRYLPHQLDELMSNSVNYLRELLFVYGRDCTAADENLTVDHD